MLAPNDIAWRREQIRLMEMLGTHANQAALEERNAWINLAARQVLDQVTLEIEETAGEAFPEGPEATRIANEMAVVFANTCGPRPIRRCGGAGSAGRRRVG